MHLHGVACVEFSRDAESRYLASSGQQHDGSFCIWDWAHATPTSSPIAAAKLENRVFSVCASKNPKEFVLAGEKTIGHYNVNTIDGIVKIGAGEIEVPQIVAKFVSLGPYCESTFIDIARGPRSRYYAVSTEGVLVSISSKKILDKWVKLKSTNAYCLSLSDGVIACGCSDSTVRLFDVGNLTYITTLPRLHPLGNEDKFLSGEIQASTVRVKGAVYADSVCCRLSQDGQNAFVVYSDRSVVQWDLAEKKNAVVLDFWLPHSGCIWGIDRCENSDRAFASKASIMTCSSDGSVRFWKTRNVEGRQLECVGIIPSSRAVQLVKPSIEEYLERIELPPQKGDGGLRCFRTNADSSQLATGDVSGNVRLYDLPTGRNLTTIPAHDGAIMVLDYCQVQSAGNNPVTLLASGSRDRLVHVFETSEKDNYKLVHTLDDHSAAITCLKVVPGAGVDDSHKLVSAAADKSLIFRKFEVDGESKINFQRYRHAQVATSITDLEINTADAGTLMASSRDKRKCIKYYSFETGKVDSTKQIRIPSGELGRVTMDTTGLLTLAATSDKKIVIADTRDGHCVGVGAGHGECITNMMLGSEADSLLTVAHDGCIVSWAVPEETVKIVRKRMGLNSAVSKPSPVKQSTSTPTRTAVAPLLSRSHSLPAEEVEVEDDILVATENEENKDSWTNPFDAIFGGSEGQLPAWMLGEDNASSGSSFDSIIPADSPWAERMDGNDSEFSRFDAGGKSGRRFTIEPNQVPQEEEEQIKSTESNTSSASASSGSDEFGSYSGVLENSTRGTNEDTQSRRLSVSTLYLNKTIVKEAAPSVVAPTVVESASSISEIAAVTSQPSDKFNEMQNKKDEQRKQLEAQVAATRARLMSLGLWKASSSASKPTTVVAAMPSEIVKSVLVRPQAPSPTPVVQALPEAEVTTISQEPAAVEAVVKLEILNNSTETVETSVEADEGTVKMENPIKSTACDVNKEMEPEVKTEIVESIGDIDEPAASDLSEQTSVVITEHTDDDSLIAPRPAAEKQKTEIVTKDEPKFENITVESEAKRPMAEESKPEESQVEESQVEESKVESQVEESQVEESQVEESQVEESQVEESQVEESRTNSIDLVDASAGDVRDIALDGPAVRPEVEVLATNTIAMDFSASLVATLAGDSADCVQSQDEESSDQDTALIEQPAEEASEASSVSAESPVDDDSYMRPVNALAAFHQSFRSAMSAFDELDANGSERNAWMEMFSMMRNEIDSVVGVEHNQKQERSPVTEALPAVNRVEESRTQDELVNKENSHKSRNSARLSLKRKSLNGNATTPTKASVQEGTSEKDYADTIIRLAAMLQSGSLQLVSTSAPASGPPKALRSKLNNPPRTPLSRIVENTLE